MSKSAREKAYFFHRERVSDEIPWLRPTDFKTITLKSPVVLINGAFDILHAPHMRLIFAARHKAGTLICALDEDQKIKRDKGVERPILSFAERAAALNYMPIDYICPINDKSDLTWLIKIVEPDLRVQGADYKDHESRFDIKKMLVREGGIHTTALIDRIIGKYKRDEDE